MKITKIIGGSLGAIALLIVSQILAQLVGSLLVIMKLPVGIGNIVAGIAYLLIAYFLLKVFAEKVLRLEINKLGIPSFHVEGKWIVVAIILPVIITSIYLLIPGEFVSSNMNNNEIFSTLSAGIVFMGIAAGVIEEIVFRGFILNLLKERCNKWIAIFLPSVLFGIVHIIGTDFDFLSCFLVICAGTMAGIMFSVIALENNSVWNSAIVHSIWNIIIIGGGLTISESPDKYSIMTYVLHTKNFVITGGEFGIESSTIALIGYIVVTLLAMRMTKKKNSVSGNN